MSAVGFWTPIHVADPSANCIYTFFSATEAFFSLTSHRAVVADITSEATSLKNEPCSCRTTAFKIICYITLFLPILLFIFKCIFRTTHNFFRITYQTIYPLTSPLYELPPVITDITPPQNQAYYFHATSKEGLQGILNTKKIYVRHQQGLRGAFFSSHPEVGFGNYVIAMNRTIEKIHRTTVASGFYYPDHYWAGFDKDIPITKDTVQFIAIPRNELASHGITIPAMLQGIPIRPLEDVQTEVEERVVQEGFIIPSHWHSRLYR